MSDVAIKVENISKLYQIGDTSSGSLRDAISGLFSSGKNKQTEDFWALNDVSFEVKKGEAVGIIGKNGAGKSTLLKVLSRITEPTRGRIEINGRVSSLLEVGTGFHPELTGRENVYLNGTILGMSRSEVKAKFDEIVDFSGVEKFLDTPVKRYSSGMKVRLAFAVAAHLEPELLIIDEVLAVGDAEFQKKCLGKMKDVAGHGRTILFVSHNMAAVENLCSRSILMQHGKKEFEGSSKDAIEQYMLKNQHFGNALIAERTDREGNGKAKVTEIHVYDNNGNLTPNIKMGQGLTVRLRIQGNLSNAIVGVLIGDSTHQQIIRGHSYESHKGVINIDGELYVDCHFENLPLVHGHYQIHTWLGEQKELADYVENAHQLEVTSADVYKTGRNLDANRLITFAPHTWSLVKKANEVDTFIR